MYFKDTHKKDVFSGRTIQQKKKFFLWLTKNYQYLMKHKKNQYKKLHVMFSAGQYRWTEKSKK